MKTSFVLPVQHYKETRIQIPGGFYTKKEPSHVTNETVEVEVDLHTIAYELGTKAVRSKGGHAQSLNGCVKVKHVRQKPNPNEKARKRK